MATTHNQPLKTETTVQLDEKNASNGTEEKGVPRNLSFWAIILAIQLSLFSAALDISAVSTALPVIISDLHGSQFIWVGSAYTLTSTAFLPLSGGLAQIFGRRVVMLGALALFALGSALCGAAPTMTFLIAGRAIQGLGSGGITSLTQIILSDIVTLRERGIFNGISGIIFGIASSTGPVIGGTLANHGAWRWVFYLNLFTSGIGAGLVISFLKLRTPAGSLQEKLARIDWLGNAIIVSSTTACILGLTWGGATFPWSSPKVLVPLVLGVVGIGAFMAYEALFAKYPLVPRILISNRTTLSGYLQTFLLPFVSFGAVYYLPVYYQASLSASPTLSGVFLLPFGLIGALCGMVSGFSVSKSGHYRPQTWIAWALCLVGCGLLTTIKRDQRARSIGFQIILGVPVGMLSALTYFPVLAPLPVQANANALALFAFMRSLGTVYGITIGGAVLQNFLLQLLPQSFLSSSNIPRGSAIAYDIIPSIAFLDEPLRSQVQAAFSESVGSIFKVLTGITGLGLLCSLVMHHHQMHTKMDDEWGIADAAREPKG